MTTVVSVQVEETYTRIVELYHEGYLVEAANAAFHLENLENFFKWLKSNDMPDEAYSLFIMIHKIKE